MKSACKRPRCDVQIRQGQHNHNPAGVLPRISSWSRRSGREQLFPGKQVKAVNAPPCQHAQKDAAKDVAGEMETQVNPRVAIQQGPQHHHSCDELLPEQQGQERDNAERIGGMAGEETVFAAAPAVHNVHKLHDFRVVRGTETMEKWLEEAG